MTKFIARGPDDVPSKTDPLWLRYDHGGKNQCMERYYHTVLPNCTGYAWGRFMEILGSTPTLSTADAGLWYSNTSDGYKRSGNYGGKPQLGAVACWGEYGSAGHVAIVEGINPDGSIVISESGYNYGYQPWSEVYHVQTVYPPNYRIGWMGSNFYFQGFIYNPACENLTSYLNDFLTEVKKHMKDTVTWVQSVLGVPITDHWNVAYIAACAKSAKVPKSILPRTTSASTLLSSSAGKLIKEFKTVELGDIVVLSKRNVLGVVIDTTTSDYVIIAGDRDSPDPTKSKVKQQTIKYSNPDINTLWRPNWGLGSTISTGNLAFTTTSLYNSRSSPGDAMCREIGYLNNKYEPSINMSGIRLSVVNYTDVVQGAFNFWAALVATVNNLDIVHKSSNAVSSGELTDVSSSERAALEYFQSKGLGIAATIGIMANIYCESHWNLTAAKVDNIEASYGLNQWNIRAGRDMRGWLQARGEDWRTSLTGQLDFLWYEATTNSVFLAMLSEINKLPDTLAGCKKAARTWVRIFGLYMIDDEPQILFDNYYPDRDAAAEMYWNKLVVQQVSDQSASKHSTHGGSTR